MVAQRLGKYDLLDRLAIGGMGEIFLARQTGAGGFQRLVVVKRLIPELAERRDLVTLFIDEARIAAHLAHPNIVQIHDFGEEGGAFYLAMEYVPGQNLARVVERAQRDSLALSRRAAVHIVAEAARALEFAHAARDEAGEPLHIVHRDVSPQNIMLSVGGEVKLMDFGIAKAAIRQQRTETGVVRGKVAYMSPEQVEGAEVDARTDVYAAGIILWELTLRRRIWGGAGELELLSRARAGVKVRPRAVEPDYPEELDDIVMRALARDPARRTQTAGELAAALRSWLGGDSAGGHSGEGAEIGALVKKLFPERLKAHAESALSAAATKAVAGTADLAAQAAAPGAVASVATPVERPVRVAGSGFRMAAWVIAAAAVVGVGAIWVRGQVIAGQTTTVAATTAVTPDAAPAPQPAAPAPQPVAVGDPPAPDPPPPDAGTAVAAVAAVDPKGPTQRPHRRSRPESKPPLAGEAPVEPAVAPPPPPPGTLVVSSDPSWANVTVDGEDWESTPATRLVKPGNYRIRIDVSKGGGSFHSTAVVESGKMTKCNKIGAAPFACDPPR